MLHTENKILFILGAYNHGGTEGQLLKLVKELKKNTNIEIEIFFLNKYGDEDLLRQFLEQDIKIYGRRYDFILQYRNESKLLLPLKKIIKNLNILKDLVLLMVTKRYSIVQSFLPEANFFATLAGLITFKKVCTGWRGLPSNMRSYRHKIVYSLVNTFSNFFSYKIIANTQKIIDEKKVYEKFVSTKKIEVINNIFLKSDISKEAKYYADELFRKNELNETVNIITIANVKEYKGYIYAIEAIKLLPENYKYLMIGDDLEDYFQQLQKKISDYGIDERVLYLGKLNHDYAMAILQKAQIYLSPSKTEGLSNSILEALMYRKKIVASDVGGTSDLLEGGKLGYLYDLGDAYQLSALLSQANSDDNLLLDKRIYLEKKYSGSSVVGKYLKAWNF